MEGTLKPSHLILPADEHGPDACVEPCCDRPDDLVCLDRLGEPLDMHGAEGPDRYPRPNKVHRLSRSEYGAGLSELLHARGKVHCLPHSAKSHLEITPNGTDDDLAGVEADTDLERYSALPLELVATGGKPRLHPKCRVAGADSVVLVGERRAKQRHDPVSHGLVDGALEMVDGFHHTLEDLVQEHGGVLGVAPCKERHGGEDVGEEHRHLLPLSRKRLASNPDPLGQMG